MASTTPSEPSPGFEQLANRYSKRVAEAVQNVEACVVMTLRVRDLSDGFPAKTGDLCQFPVRQPATGPLLVDVYALSQSYRVVVSSFLLALGYWGYPDISSLDAAPSFRGRALGTTSAGSCPPGCHFRQSCEALSDGALLLVQCAGNRGNRSSAHAIQPICITCPGSATGTRVLMGTVVQQTLPESTGTLVGSAWRPYDRRGYPLRGPHGTGRDA